MLPNEIFLSHSDLDRHFVECLATVTRRHGLRVWYCRTNIQGGQQWHDEVGMALNRCDWFAIVLSPNAVKSTWAKRELIFSLQQRRYENRIIPLLYQPCNFEQLSWTISSFQMVDFTQTVEQGYRDLFNIWGLRYDDE
ncbi:MAG: toll/interleukin-1 receptor domain-containing protein [Gemmatimonadota bacterium]|nr:toll/interleukin-1 receptor domain-containing protein [Gemmatimonadota bacterium]